MIRTTMDYVRFHRRIAEHLDRLLANQPRGTKKDLCARVGVGPSWLSDFRRAKTTCLRPVVEMLHAMNIHPGDFIREATLQPVGYGVETAADRLATTASLGRRDTLEMRAERLSKAKCYDQAAKLYELVLELHLAHAAWMRAAVVTLRLCIALRLAGRTRRALEVAKGSLRLYGRLDSHSAKTTVTILAREASVSHRLEPDLLDRLLADLLAAGG